MSDNLKKSITKNIFSLLIGQGANLVLNFFAIILAARYLGVNEFGEFSYYIALVSIISKFIDAGFSPIIFRETSKNLTDYELVNLGLVLRTGIFVVVILLFNLAAAFQKMNINQIIFINFLMFGIIFSSKFQNFRDILEIPFKVNLKMHYPMILNLIDNLFFLLFVALMPFLKAGLNYFIIIYTVTNLPGFFLLLFFLSKKFNYRFCINLNKIKWLINESLPIFGFVILTVVFTQADIIFLKYFGSTYATGIYAGAVRLSMPLAIIPTSLVFSVVPLLVKNVTVNQEQNNKITTLCFKILFLISSFIAIVYSFKKMELTNLILGNKYSASAFPLELLLWSQIFLFINYFALDLFLVYNKQIWNFYFSVLVVVVNLLANLFLIPIFSYNAPAIAKLIAGIAGFLMVVGSIIKLHIKVDVRFKELFILLITSIVLIYFASYLPLLLYIPMVIFIFILIIFVTRYLSFDEIEFILSLAKMPELSSKIRRYYL